MKTTLSASAIADAIYLKAYYVGPDAKYGDIIPKSAILVKIIYPDKTEEVVTDWEYLRGNIVMIGNNAKLYVQYQSYITSVEIPLIYKKVISFECHYHGEPVLIGTEFDPKKLHARAIYGDKTWKDLHSWEYEISDMLVTKEGNDNVYTATYKGLKDNFAVFGYWEDKTDKDFKIFKLDDKMEIDITDVYYPLFYNDLLGNIYISTMRLDRTLSEGKYRLILPKNTGLNCKYASEWIVIKSNNGVKVTPVKFYRKEDNKNG